MRKIRLFALIFALLLAIQMVAVYSALPNVAAQSTPSVYVGVDIAYGAVADAKAIIDQVSPFTNLVVVGSTQVTWFPDRVNQTFQYAYDKGLSIISLSPSLPDGSSIGMNKTEWYGWAQNTWGNKLLGFYIMDEPGGRQIDGTQKFTWNNYTGYPTSYTDAANQFTEGISRFLNNQRAPAYYKAFTSDYALYWYDYKSGYDTVFAELGWNYSRQINIALARGAAAQQGKDWGAMITWTYTAPPYIESGDQLYNDMVRAYDNGAKYIVVFNSDENGHTILQQEHLDAMQRFWNYAKTNLPKTVAKSDRSAYVLPNAYGFGFRWPTDHIWGVWEADELSANISLSVGTLLSQYGEKLDIIYNDGLQSGSNGYSQLIYWNNYDPTPTASPSPPPTPTASPTASPTPDPTPATIPTAILIAGSAILAALVCAVPLFYFKRKGKLAKSR